jgi:pimeloyl-ACP methyl ester carboxylesterase
VTFNTSDGVQLHGWFFNTPGAQNTVLLNWSGFGDVRYAAALGYVKMLQQAKLSAFVYDYRGLGKSTGKSTLTSAEDDGLAAYDYLTKQKKISPKHLILMGREVGAYVACKINRLHPCAALILEEPWINLKNWTDARSPIMSMVPLACYPADGLSNLPSLKESHPPILVVSTDYYQDGPRELYDEIGNPKRMLTLDQECMMFLDLKGHTADRYSKKITALLTGAPERMHRNRSRLPLPGQSTGQVISRMHLKKQSWKRSTC